MLRANKHNKHHDAKYRGKGKRRSDYNSHGEWRKNNPEKSKVLKSIKYQERMENYSLKQLLEAAAIGVLFAGGLYLGSKGYFPEINSNELNKVNYKLSASYDPIKETVDSLSTILSTNPLETKYSNKKDDYSINYSIEYSTK